MRSIIRGRATLLTASSKKLSLLYLLPFASCGSDFFFKFRGGGKGGASLRVFEVLGGHVYVNMVVSEVLCCFDCKTTSYMHQVTGLQKY